MNARTQEIMAWAGPLSLVVFALGASIAHLAPPIAPTATAIDVAAFYARNAQAIEITAVLFAIGGTCHAIFTAAIAIRMHRMNEKAQALTLLQAIAGSLNTMAFFFAGLFMAVAAYRPDRSPELILLLSDLVWTIFIPIPVWVADVQLLVIGIAVLGAPPSRQALPRWTGYLSLFSILLYTPGAIACLFKAGPFAWDGLLSFWVAAIDFPIWLIGMSVALIGAARRDTAA